MKTVKLFYLISEQENIKIGLKTLKERGYLHNIKWEAISEEICQHNSSK